VRGVGKSMFRLTGRTEELEQHEIEDACLYMVAAQTHLSPEVVPCNFFWQHMIVEVWRCFAQGRIYYCQQRWTP
jgi:hypothetical protein